MFNSYVTVMDSNLVGEFFHEKCWILPVRYVEHGPSFWGISQLVMFDYQKVSPEISG